MLFDINSKIIFNNTGTIPPVVLVKLAWKELFIRLSERVVLIPFVAYLMLGQGMKICIYQFLSIATARLSLFSRGIAYAIFHVH